MGAACATPAAVQDVQDATGGEAGSGSAGGARGTGGAAGRPGAGAAGAAGAAVATGGVLGTGGSSSGGSTGLGNVTGSSGGATGLGNANGTGGTNGMDGAGGSAGGTGTGNACAPNVGTPSCCYCPESSLKPECDNLANSVQNCGFCGNNCLTGGATCTNGFCSSGLAGPPPASPVACPWSIYGASACNAQGGGFASKSGRRCYICKADARGDFSDECTFPYDNGTGVTTPAICVLSCSECN